MSAGVFRVPKPINEPVLAFAPGSRERASLHDEIVRQAAEVVEVPCIIGGKDVFTGKVTEVRMPAAHGHVLARVHMAGPDEVAAAVAAAEAARPAWADLPWEHRAAVFLKASTLLAGPWRNRVNAATMLGQGKTCHQAEIDAACELIDFFRFNVWYAQQIYSEQPPENSPGTWNRLDHRPLDGFVLAIAPFNFTSISVNLPTSPAILGNTVLWKAATTAVLSSYYAMRMLQECGLPPGVINLLHGAGADVGDAAIRRPELGGVHFTGSTGVFRGMWRTVAETLSQYRCYPRLVGETGGKDFIVAHPSADAAAVAVGILRGAFEYQGQKCSAASRMYVPKSLWPEVRDRVAAGIGEMKMGDTRDFSNFLGPVIDKRAFDKHRHFLALGKETATIVAGGEARGDDGWFIDATFVQVDDPHHRLMEEEIFGPIATAFVYDDAQWADTLRLVDTTSPYALTGAVFARDRAAIVEAEHGLRHAAGNFYINDKPTGAVVGQQPFGGGRASGTNDKAGSLLNLLRWANPRTVKETFDPPTDWRYPFLG